MVWGGVSQPHRTELVVIAGNLKAVHYREDILLYHVVHFLQAHPDMTFQHDNATTHTVRDCLQDRDVSVLPWPAKSPDLNPVEHVWDLLDRRVRARAIPLRNVWELTGALVEEWGNISQQELANQGLPGSPGSVTANWEAHGAAHNWPSVVRVSVGLASRHILVSSRTSDSCGRRVQFTLTRTLGVWCFL